VPERDSSGQPSAEEQLRALYENAESTAAKAFEQAVSTPSFGEMLARSAENMAALSRMGSDFADAVLRNLRVAGRSDITRLARQLHRTEDKLERVLQEIEQLRDELARAQESAADGNGRASGAGARSGTAKRTTGSGSGARGGGGSGGGGRGGRDGGGSSGSGGSGGSTRSRSRAT
jgi:ABC-type transporter Mla subunit MlaD